MKPMPPSPLFHGSRTDKAKAVATTASTAVPPAARMSAPTEAATPFCAATTPPRDATAGFRTTQFCISAMSCHLDRIDPGRIEGVIPRQSGHLVERRPVAPDRILRAAHRVAVADLQGPVRRVALERAMRAVIGRPHQVGAHVFLWKIMHRPVPGLLAAQCIGGVGDD